MGFEVGSLRQKSSSRNEMRENCQIEQIHLKIIIYEIILASSPDMKKLRTADN
jgi:hypothetical protein